MTDVIGKSLEIGVGFIVFVLGLSALFLMGQHMTDYLQTVEEAGGEAHSYSSVTHSDPTYYVTKEMIHCILLEHSVDSIWIDGIELLTLKKRLKDQPGVAVNEVMEAIHIDLAGVSEGEYEEMLIVDQKGIVMSADYKHK